MEHLDSSLGWSLTLGGDWRRDKDVGVCEGFSGWQNYNFFISKLHTALSKSRIERIAGLSMVSLLLYLGLYRCMWEHSGKLRTILCSFLWDHSEDKSWSHNNFLCITSHQLLMMDKGTSPVFIWIMISKANGQERSMPLGQQLDSEVEEVTEIGLAWDILVKWVGCEQRAGPAWVWALTSTVIPCSLHSMATAPRKMLSNTQKVDECALSLLPVNQRNDTCKSHAMCSILLAPETKISNRHLRQPQCEIRVWSSDSTSLWMCVHSDILAGRCPLDGTYVPSQGSPKQVPSAFGRHRKKVLATKTLQPRVPMGQVPSSQPVNPF